MNYYRKWAYLDYDICRVINLLDVPVGQNDKDKVDIGLAFARHFCHSESMQLD